MKKPLDTSLRFFFIFKSNWVILLLLKSEKTKKTLDAMFKICAFKINLVISLFLKKDNYTLDQCINDR